MQSKRSRERRVFPRRSPLSLSLCNCPATFQENTWPRTGGSGHRCALAVGGGGAWGCCGWKEAATPNTCFWGPSWCAKSSILAWNVMPVCRMAGDSLSSAALGRVAWCFGACSSDGLPAG